MHTPLWRIHIRFDWKFFNSPSNFNKVPSDHPSLRNCRVPDTISVNRHLEMKLTGAHSHSKWLMQTRPTASDSLLKATFSCQFYFLTQYLRLKLYKFMAHFLWSLFVHFLPKTFQLFATSIRCQYLVLDSYWAGYTVDFGPVNSASNSVDLSRTIRLGNSREKFGSFTICTIVIVNFKQNLRLLQGRIARIFMCPFSRTSVASSLTVLSAKFIYGIIRSRTPLCSEDSWTFCSTNFQRNSRIETLKWSSTSALDKGL